jgi:hypothetical protein
MMAAIVRNLGVDRHFSVINQGDAQECCYLVESGSEFKIAKSVNG